MGEMDMLIDMHAHSSGISRCCKIPFDQVLRTAKEHGIDGIVLTNHYQRPNEGTVDAFVDQYIEEYQRALAYGRENGHRVFFGIEVTMALYPGVHMLVYGVTPDFLRAHPFLFDCTQDALYRLVKSEQGILVQAHPFRNNTTVLDPKFLDGVESYCHPKYKNAHSDRLMDIARENHLLVTCGGDYHADTYRPECGMFMPDEIATDADLKNWLEAPIARKLHVHEVNGSIHDMIG